MKWLILFLFLLSIQLFFLYGLQTLFSSNRRLDKRMKHYLQKHEQKKLSLKHFNVLVHLHLYKQSLRDKMLRHKKGLRLEQQLEQAGIPLKPEEYVMFRWIIFALCGGLVYLLTNQVMLMLLGFAIGFVLPRWWLRKKKKDRIHAFNQALPDMISTMVGSLRAGFSFAQSLQTVVAESPSPLKEEIELVLKEMQYGRHIEDALHELKERMPSEDLELMIQSILIQRQVGGNLATVLETIVFTIRERNRIQNQVVTLTAQGRLSGIVIGCLPLAVGIMIYMIEPDYMSSFFQHPIGMFMLGGGAVSGTLGFILIRKLTTIEV